MTSQYEIKFRNLLGCSCKIPGGTVTIKAGESYEHCWMTIYPFGRMSFGKDFNLEIMKDKFWPAICPAIDGIGHFDFQDLVITTGRCGCSVDSAKITLTKDKKCILENFLLTDNIINIWETIAKARPKPIEYTMPLYDTLPTGIAHNNA